MKYLQLKVPSLFYKISQRSIFQKNVIVLITAILFISNFGFAQPSIAWEKTFGGSNAEQGQFIKATPDGGFIAGSYSYSSDGDVLVNYGGSDWWITKHDSDGNIEWQNNLGGGIQDFPQSIEITPDGGYIVIGSTLSTVQPSGNVGGTTYGSWDVWVIKLDITGSVEWEKNYGGSGTDYGFDIKNVEGIGGYMFVAHSTSNDFDINDNDGDQDIWVVFISETGAILSEKTHGGSEFENAEKIIGLDNGFFLIAGTTASNDGDISVSKGGADFWIFEVSLQADLLWEKTFGGSGSDLLKDCILTNDGGFLLVGGSASSDFDVSGNLGSFDRWMIKLDANREKEWDQNFGNFSNNKFTDVVQTANGEYLVMDETYDISLIDGQGNEEWSWTYPLNYDDFNFFDLIGTDNGGFTAIGMAKVPLNVGFNLETLIVNFESIVPTSCPDDLNGFVTLGEFNGSKYFLSEGTSGAPAAQDVADANGGFLAVINSQEENDFIQQNISEMVYIGLNDFDSEGNLVWVNGDLLDFDNVNPCGFCNENSDEQDFVIIQPWDGAWSFSNFYNQRKYLIEVPCGNVTPPANPSDCSFMGGFNVPENPYEICVEEIQDGYKIKTLSYIDLLNPTNFFLDEASINFNGEVSSVSQSLDFILSNTTFLSQSKTQNLVYALDNQTNNVVALDNSLNELWILDLPYPPSFDPMNPIYPYFSLKNIQITEFGDITAVVMDGYFGLYETQGGGLISSNLFFLSGDYFGQPIKSEDGGYFVQVDNSIVKLNENLIPVWIHVVGSYFDEVIIMPDKGNSNDLYYYFNFVNYDSVYKLDGDTGNQIWEKDLSNYRPVDAIWWSPRSRSGVASNDGGFVMKINYVNVGVFDKESIFMKFDEEANVEWQYTWDESFVDFEVNLALADGGYFLTKHVINKLHYFRTNIDGSIDVACNDQLPDLRLNRVEGFFGTDTLLTGENLEIFYSFYNAGFTDIIGDYQLKVYLSTDIQLDGNDVLLSTYDFFDTPKGFLTELTVNIQVPNSVNSDNYVVIFSLDDGNAVEEFQENNNLYRSFSFYVKNNGTGPTINCPGDLLGFTSLGEFGTSKYYISDDVAKPTEAVANLPMGYLAVINSEQENDFIANQLTEMAYIGLNDFDVEGELIWGNGDPIGFTNFDICNFCNSNSEEMDFVMMHSWNGGWSWSNFYNSRKYIVEVPCSSTLIDPTINNFSINLTELERGNGQLILEEIYPNPTTENVFVKIISQIDQNLPIEKYDAQGILVKKEMILLQGGKNTIELSISNLPDGFYSVLISQINGKSDVKRFVKVGG